MKFANKKSGIFANTFSFMSKMPENSIIIMKSCQNSEIIIADAIVVLFPAQLNLTLSDFGP